MSRTSGTWEGTGDEGNEVADTMVMTSGLSSAFIWSDINVLSRETLHTTSNTPHEQTGKRRVTDVSPGKQIQDYFTVKKMYILKT